MHLKTVGVANQTTMLRGRDRRGPAAHPAGDHRPRRPGEAARKNFRFFDTICGATQERQDALKDMLVLPMNLLLVVGGYNSSNTSHLAEMGAAQLPTYFIRDASRLESQARITHFDLHQGQEVVVENWLPTGDTVVGVTAGASCPNHLIEETIKRLFAFRGVNAEELI